MATVRIPAGAPPGQKAERPTGQGEAFKKRIGLETRNNLTTVFTRRAAYVAWHRLRCKRAGCREPAEVIS